MHAYWVVGVGLFVIAVIIGTIVKNWPIYQRDINEALKHDEEDW